MISYGRPLCALFVAFLSISTSVSAAPYPDTHLQTNAARMLAGLGPLKPRALFDPTRVHDVRDSEPSSLPSPPTTTHLQVRDDSGAVLGFVQKFPNDAGLYGYTSDPKDSLTIQVPQGASAPFDIKAIHDSPGAYPNLGFSIGTTIPYLSAGIWADLVTTDPVPAGSGPKQVYNSRTGAFSDAESAVWDVTSGGQLIPSWIDPDGVKIPVTVHYNPNIPSIILNAQKFDDNLTDFPTITLWAV